MFEIKEQFYLDGKPLQIISGAFHYFRTVPEYWRENSEGAENEMRLVFHINVPYNDLYATT